MSERDMISTNTNLRYIELMGCLQGQTTNYEPFSMNTKLESSLNYI